MACPRLLGNSFGISNGKYLFAIVRDEPRHCSYTKRWQQAKKLTHLNKTTRNKLIIFPILFILGFFLFYKFMTYDRNYTWSKEYSFEVEKALENLDFEFQKSEKINNENIKLPNEKWIKLKIQKLLNKVDLMNYGTEFGEKITLNSTKSEQLLICKGWCLSDHLIGIEIEHKNIDSKTLEKIKQRFESQFPNYKLIWTEL